MQEPLPEGALVALLYRSVGASETAREELLARLWVAIFPYVHGLIRNRDDAEDLAEDLTQETLLRLLPKLWLCRATVDAEVVSWALTIAHRVVIDEYRRHVRVDVRRLSPELEAVAYHDAGDHPHSCERYRPENVMERLMRTTMTGLPTELQRLLELRVLRGATWTEVGDSLGTTAAGAKRRFQRAQVALRRELLQRAEKLPPRKRAVVQAFLRRFGR
ncbi:MAG TPA: sigma-70 family RNA polymerase sigma factor [Longimicrobiaceae bacterium]|jgi:RNA polymerase sigma-70 factor (ECF subfamily)